MTHLHAGFQRSAVAHADRPALRLHGRTWTYAQLDQLARVWAAALLQVGDVPQRVGVLAHQSLVSYVGTLACLYVGATVVPLNPASPPARLDAMARKARVEALLVDTESARLLPDLLGLPPMPLLAPVSRRADLFTDPGYPLLDEADVAAFSPLESTVDGTAEQVAYLVFGPEEDDPRGVPITHGNAGHFFDAHSERRRLPAGERFSQLADLTSELAVLDLFTAWNSGGCLFPYDPELAGDPVGFVAEHDITVWCSAPSLAIQLVRANRLGPHGLGSLRLSLFVGEALPTAVAQAWQEAAPGSVVEHLYGRPEVGIACTVHRWDPETAPAVPVPGNVPIGRPLAGVAVLLTEAGELCVSGPQVFAGYWEDSAATAERFLTRAGADGVPQLWFRTGDLAVQLGNGEFACLGRLPAAGRSTPSGDSRPAALTASAI